MKNSKPVGLAAWLLGAAWLAVSGAAWSADPAAKQLDPETLKQKVQESNGYLALKQGVAPGTSKIVLRGNTVEKRHIFGLNFTEMPCDEYKVLEAITNPGWEQNIPAVAQRIARWHKGFTEAAVPPDQSVQVRAGMGDFDWTMKNLPKGLSCGPVHYQFTPKADKVYLAEFYYIENKCFLMVSDATDPDAPVPVPRESLRVCAPKPVVVPSYY